MPSTDHNKIVQIVVRKLDECKNVHYLVQDEFHPEMGVIINDVDSDQTNYHIVNGQTNSLA